MAVAVAVGILAIIVAVVVVVLVSGILNRCYVRRKKEFTTVAIVMLWFVMFRSG